MRLEHDIVALRRRTRAACEQLGLADRDVRSFSAATFEAARALFAEAGELSAELGPADDRFEVTLTAPASGPDVVDRLRRALDQLHSLVQVTVEHHPDVVTVRLQVALPATVPVPAVARSLRSSFPTEQEENTASLQRRIKELQLELGETNRGVIALYAELDDHAERLRQAEDRFRVLLDSVQDYAICMLDPKGQVVSWNAGAERLFGYSSDEIIGRHFAAFYSAAERDLAVPAAQLGEARESGRCECECLRVRRGGSAFDAHVLLTSVRASNGELRGFSLVVRDTTMRKRLEDDLRRRADDLAAANRAKEDFLATLSHELRTPLNAMLGWTRLLRMGKLDERAMARALETIERNAHIQEQLIADILDVSRIVTGKLRLSLRPVELGPVIDASLEAVSPAADAKGIRLSSDVRFDGHVLGDPDRLQQVAWNLLANAIKFTPAGGSVTLTVKREGAAATMTVADTGEGIAADLLPFIFDRFRQGDASATRAHGGLGLGLSIVRHIVELHGGRVEARSDGPGRGAVFSVYLPVRSAAQANAMEDGPLEVEDQSLIPDH